MKKLLTIVLIFLFSGVAQSMRAPIEQTYKPSIDVLFIMDNSASIKMGKNEDRNVQNLFAVNADIFVEQLSDVKFLDYNVGVVQAGLSEEKPIGSLEECTMVDGGNARHFSHIRSGMPMKIKNQCLIEMMKIEGIGSANETFLDMPLITLLNSGNFHRPEAQLGIFAITNSDDQSSLNHEQAGKMLEAFKGDKRKVQFSAAISTVEEHFSDVCQMEQSGQPPYKIPEVVNYFGGQLFELCDFNYGKVLFEFAQSLVESVLTVPLESSPNTGTIEVYYSYQGKSTMILNGWGYNRESNSVRLPRDLKVEPGGVFKIKYEPI